jgi:hypothetical protein
MITLETTFGAGNRQEEGRPPRSTNVFVPIGGRAIIASKVTMRGMDTQGGFNMHVFESPKTFIAAKESFSPDKPQHRASSGHAKPMDAHPWLTKYEVDSFATGSVVLLAPSIVGNGLYVSRRLPGYGDQHLDQSMTDHFGYAQMTPVIHEGEIGMSMQVVMPEGSYLGMTSATIHVERTPQ